MTFTWTGAEEAIKKLKSLGLRTAMLTGDSQAAAMHAQNQLHHALDEVCAELLPEDKARFITDLKKIGPTAMVGDGVNNAPALVTTDIGISMGVSGSTLATETSHVILMTNDVRKVPKAILLARKALRKVVENVILSIVTKVAILALAIAGHPYVWAAVLTDVGTCLLVILNSMLLLREGGHWSRKCCKSVAQQTGACDAHEVDMPEDCHKCCSANNGLKTSSVGGCLTKANSNNQKPSLGLHFHHGHERRHHDCHSKDKSAPICQSCSSRTKSCQNTSPREETWKKQMVHYHSYTHPQEASEDQCYCVTNEVKPHDSPEVETSHSSHCLEGHDSEEEANRRKCGVHHRHIVGSGTAHDKDRSSRWAIDIESGHDQAKFASSSSSSSSLGYKKRECESLGSRELGGCCRSYMKECCRNHGHVHLRSGFGGGGGQPPGCLSEITITTE